jgi:hypothetical protein
MVIRLIIGALLAAVVLMGWGFVFWAFSPVSDSMVKRLPDEPAVIAALKKSNLETGHYFYPYPDKDIMAGKDPSKTEAWKKEHRDGPLVEISYNKQGEDPMNPIMYAMGFVHFFAGALLAGLLLILALPRLPTYLGRVGFVFLLGLFATVALQLADPIWFHHPWGFALLKGGFDVGCWLLAGLVLAAFLRPQMA